MIDWQLFKRAESQAQQIGSYKGEDQSHDMNARPVFAQGQAETPTTDKPTGDQGCGSELVAMRGQSSAVKQAGKLPPGTPAPGEGPYDPGEEEAARWEAGKPSPEWQGHYEENKRQVADAMAWPNLVKIQEEKNPGWLSRLFGAEPQEALYAHEGTPVYLDAMQQKSARFRVAKPPQGHLAALKKALMNKHNWRLSANFGLFGPIGGGIMNYRQLKRKRKPKKQVPEDMKAELAAKTASDENEPGMKNPTITPKTQSKVTQFLKRNPKADDASFHEFAEDAGLNSHAAEAAAYRTASECLKSARALAKMAIWPFSQEPEDTWTPKLFDRQGPKPPQKLMSWPELRAMEQRYFDTLGVGPELSPEDTARLKLHYGWGENDNNPEALDLMEAMFDAEQADDYDPENDVEFRDALYDKAFKSASASECLNAPIAKSAADFMEQLQKEDDAIREVQSTRELMRQNRRRMRRGRRRRRRRKSALAMFKLAEGDSATKVERPGGMSMGSALKAPTVTQSVPATPSQKVLNAKKVTAPALPIDTHLRPTGGMGYTGSMRFNTLTNQNY